MIIVVGIIWWDLAERRTISGGLRPVVADLPVIVGDGNLQVINLASVVFNVGQQSFSTCLTLFLRDEAGVSQASAALCVGLSQVTNATGSVC